MSRCAALGSAVVVAPTVNCPTHDDAALSGPALTVTSPWMWKISSLVDASVSSAAQIVKNLIAAGNKSSLGAASVAAISNAASARTATGSTIADRAPMSRWIRD